MSELAAKINPAVDAAKTMTRLHVNPKSSAPTVCTNLLLFKSGYQLKDSYKCANWQIDNYTRNKIVENFNPG